MNPVESGSQQGLYGNIQSERLQKVNIEIMPEHFPEFIEQAEAAFYNPMVHGMLFSSRYSFTVLYQIHPSSGIYRDKD